MNYKVLLAASVLSSAMLLGACGKEEMKESSSKSSMMNKKMSQSDEMMDKKMMEGTFKGKHEKVEGMAKIENNMLVLDKFKSSKGPDLHVYLTKDNDIKSGMKIDKVKYDEPMQKFNLKNKDVSMYNTVTIYCDKAHVIFGSATLK